MPHKLAVGPIVGLESDISYTVCFLSDSSVTAAKVAAGELSVNATHVGDVHSGKFWRAELEVPVPSGPTSVTYSIELDGLSAPDQHGRTSWTFHVPAKGDQPRFAYTSCNGFSSSELMGRTDEPYRLWRQMQHSHDNEPFSLLIMGGDQLYADDIWIKASSLERWSRLKRDNRTSRTATNEMRGQIERFYDEIYRTRWRDEAMSYMLASVPSIMMWDDHDIFDGWGSYPDDMQSCPVYAAIFETASRYFELYQIRTRRNNSLLDQNTKHFAFGFTFRGYHLLALDNRAERTLTQVMSNEQWKAIIDFLDGATDNGDLLVLSAVPVIYRDFSLTEAAFDITPWEEDLTDDLKDHWRAREHQGERARLIMRLLQNAKARTTSERKARTVILSGDVHLGCLGVVNDRRDGTINQVHQVVSSGIVHPAPSRIQWLGIMALTNDDIEYLNESRTVETVMLKPFQSHQYIRSRNYVTLNEGTDNKLWINWECESKDKPVFPLE